MERIQRSATIRADGPPLRLQVTLGDGLRGSCTAHILAGSAHTHTLQVEVDGSAVAVPIEALLVDDAHIDWLVIVFGPGADAPYHLLLDLLQGEASALDCAAFNQLAWDGADTLSADVTNFLGAELNCAISLTR